MNIMIDVLIGICIFVILHILVYMVYRKNQTNPIFHNDNNIKDIAKDLDQELIYKPLSSYMDKLEYSDFDLKKVSPIPRHRRSYESQKDAPFSTAKDLKKKKKI